MSAAQVISDHLVLIQMQISTMPTDDIIRKSTTFFINMVVNILPLLTAFIPSKYQYQCISVYRQFVQVRAGTNGRRVWLAGGQLD